MNIEYNKNQLGKKGGWKGEYEERREGRERREGEKGGGEYEERREEEIRRGESEYWRDIEGKSVFQLRLSPRL